MQRLGLTSIREINLRPKIPLGELLANLLSLICRGMMNTDVAAQEFGSHSQIWVSSE